MALAGAWLGWTVLVDFFVVPMVFREVDDFFQAGALGIGVFTKLNNLELIVGSVMVALSALNVKKSPSALIAFCLSLLLLALAITYFTFLTPKITAVTALWKKADLMGLQGLSGIADLQQEHQFWHRLYIGLDTLKLATLSIFIGLGIARGSTWK